MPNHFNDRLVGHIRGLRLPPSVWNSLRDEGISTLDQLKAVADELEGLVGIGPKTARIIRDEIARISGIS